MADKPNTKPVAFRMPMEVYDRVREIAYLERRTIQSVVMEGLQLAFKKREGAEA